MKLDHDVGPLEGGEALTAADTDAPPPAHPGVTLQDKKVKDKIDSRNQLETYLYNMKTNVEDKMKDKIPADDKVSGTEN